MKWSIPQLKKIQKFPFSFSETIDYKDAIKHVSDILDIDLVKVDGKIDKIDDEKVDFIICLGDLVGYGPHPNEVVSFIKSCYNKTGTNKIKEVRAWYRR